MLQLNEELTYLHQAFILCHTMQDALTAALVWACFFTVIDHCLQSMPAVLLLKTCPFDCQNLCALVAKNKHSVFYSREALHESDLLQDPNKGVGQYSSAAQTHSSNPLVRVLAASTADAVQCIETQLQEWHHLQHVVVCREM